MTDSHPLDNPVWNCLNGRQSDFAIGSAVAKRFLPDVNIFAAAGDDSPEALDAIAALLPDAGQLARLDAYTPPALPGMRLTFQAAVLQMVAPVVDMTPARAIDWIELGPEQGPEMVALATLTKPGPFFARTWALGRFIGVRREGRLVAMAGERMKPDGFTEVSAVCTHPDWRGHGFGASLTAIVTARIHASGEPAYLHVYPDNRAAVDIYRALGFETRREMIYSIYER